MTADEIMARISSNQWAAQDSGLSYMTKIFLSVSTVYFPACEVNVNQNLWRNVTEHPAQPEKLACQAQGAQSFLMPQRFKDF
jgi:hypothetical protein